MSTADGSLFGNEISESLKKLDLSRPIALLNMIKFRDQAEYGLDSNERPCTGEEAYLVRYMSFVKPLLESVGATIHLSGLFSIEGPSGEWDRVFVVKYKRCADFLELATNNYANYGHHRAAALSDSRLLVMDFDPMGSSV